MPEQSTKDNLKEFLQRSRPDWSDKSLEAVIARLSKIKIDNVLVLILALRGKGVWKKEGINKKLENAGEKQFTTDTLTAMLSTATALEQEIKQEKPVVKQQSVIGATINLRQPVAGADAQPEESKSPTQHSINWEAVAPKLKPTGVEAETRPFTATSSAPTRHSGRTESGQDFQVVQDIVYVMKKPDLHESVPVLSQLVQGQMIHAVEETFDGWVRLANDEGWVLKEAPGNSDGAAYTTIKVIAPVGEPPFLAIPDALGQPGPEAFQVVCESTVEVKKSPETTARTVDYKQTREWVLADAQSYNGWVHLVKEDGWLRVTDADGSQILKSRLVDNMQQFRAAVASLKDADASSHGSNHTYSNRWKAKATGLKILIAELQQEQKKYREMRQRIQRAIGKEEPLRACVKAAHDAKFPGEELLAKYWLELLRLAQAEAEPERDCLLEELAVAAQSGNPIEIKAARDAAKQAGVPSKDIARIFSLHCRG